MQTVNILRTRSSLSFLIFKKPGSSFAVSNFLVSDPGSNGLFSPRMKNTIILYKFPFPIDEKKRERERERESFESRELTADGGPL
jgi:hypothetical protein